MTITGLTVQDTSFRNGVVYRDTVREDSSNGDLAIYKDGSFKIIYEDEISADQLVKDGVVNLLAFGPSLVENGEITVDTNLRGRAIYGV